MSDDNFLPEQSEQVSDALPHGDERLERALREVYQPLAKDHQRSLERVRLRLAQQEASNRISPPKQGKHPEGKIIALKEKNIMEDKNVSWGMNSSPEHSQAKKPRSILRIVGTVLIAAVALITILSFTIFSGVLRPAPQASSLKPSTQTGAPGQQSQPVQQKAISNGKLVCSVGVDDRPLPPFTRSRALPSWPIQGKIVANYTDGSTLFSAKDCSGKKALTIGSVLATGSPDGNKIAISNYSTKTLDILDSNGNMLKSISYPQLGSVNVSQVAWSSDSTLIFLSSESNYVSTIKSIDANGGNLKTLVSTDGERGGKGFVALSSAGKYALMVQFNRATKTKDMSIWDVNAGKQVSTLPPNGYGTFSPDGSQIAVSGADQIRIFSTSDGKPVSTLDYKNALDLAWSPDGKYLAVCNTSISIFDVTTKQSVATFGQVTDAAKQQIVNMAWSPDGTGLVSSLDQPDDGHTQTPINVWALS